MTHLKDLIARHVAEPLTQTAIDGLVLSHSDCTTESRAGVYHPLLCVLVQGRKRARVGDEEFLYDPHTYLIATTDLPASGQVIEAPCLGLTLRLDPSRIASLLLEMERGEAPEPPLMSMAVAPLDSDLEDSLVRLLKLLDTPGQIPILAPGIEREILYRLLLGPRGRVLRQIAAPDSVAGELARALEAVRENYQQTWRIEQLAELCDMSPTSFHRHFRAFTGLSPLQYIKQYRLHQARQRLLSQPSSIARISSDVGYESASQFSREYRRLFGASPSQDITALRALASGR